MEADQKAAKRKRNAKRRFIVYGSLGVILTALYYYQPQRIDLIPRHPPVPNPAINPDSDRLFSKGVKVAIVTAHPDDAEFYLGGTLTRLGAAGAEITLIVCTSGDKSYYPWENGARLGKIREGEQEAAFHRWHGANLFFLRFPDGRLHPNQDVKDAVLALLKKVDPEYLIGFDPDFPPRVSHGDHRSAGAVLESVAPLTGAKWLLEFQTIASNYVVDISDQWEEKKALLALHASQFHGGHLEGIINFVGDMAAEDGEKIGVTFGEGLRCVKLHP